MSPMDALRDAIDPALAELPERMASDAARVMLVAIGLQESRLTWRRQHAGGVKLGGRNKRANACPDLTTNQPVMEVRPMADANSIPLVARSPNGTPLFKNECPDCGKTRFSDKRRIGKPCMSCANKRRATHGMSEHPLYRLIKMTIQRCTNPRATNYAYYGGRGITVCDEWVNDPMSFIEWAGANGYERGLELDRLDNDGPYAPWNCQFIAHRDNSRKRGNKRCDVEKAAEIKKLLASGVAVRDVARTVDVPYMVAWHISKGHTWKGI